MFSEVDRDILRHLLAVGNDAPSNIAECIDTNSKYVSERLRELKSKDLVVNRGSGVWALTVDGTATARAIRREELEE